LGDLLFPAPSRSTVFSSSKDFNSQRAFPKSFERHGSTTQQPFKQRSANSPVCAMCPRASRWIEIENETTQAEETLLLDFSTAAAEPSVGTNSKTQEAGDQSCDLGGTKEKMEKNLGDGQAGKESSCEDQDLEEGKEIEVKGDMQIETQGWDQRERKRWGNYSCLRKVEDEILEETVTMREHWAWGTGQIFSPTKTEILANESLGENGIFVDIPILDYDDEYIDYEDENDDLDLFLSQEDGDTSQHRGEQYLKTSLDINENLIFEWTLPKNDADALDNNSLLVLGDSVPDMIEYEPTLVEQLLSRPVPDTFLIDGEFLDWFGARYIELTAMKDEQRTDEEEEDWDWDWVLYAK
jgi:hypothetical protein